MNCGKRFAILIAAQAGAWSLAGCAFAAWDWHENVTPHFLIRHEAAFMPPVFSLSLEKVHSRLRLDLAMFSPWMAKERVKLYLYKSSRSYLAGEFKPPSWSNGIAYYERKLLAVYDQADRRKLMEVIAHETTHLLFESYWGEARRKPPHWLNEGLAMMEEGEALPDADRSQWSQAMSVLPGVRLIAVRDVVAITPATDIKDQETLTLWYVESYSLVYFLYRKHSRLQFFRFCKRLRDGRTLQDALWDAYRFRDLAAFETAWLKWLATLRRGKGLSKTWTSDPPVMDMSQGRSFKKVKLKPVNFGNFQFRSLRGEPENPRSR